MATNLEIESFLFVEEQSGNDATTAANVLRKMADDVEQGAINLALTASYYPKVAGDKSTFLQLTTGHRYDADYTHAEVFEITSPNPRIVHETLATFIRVGVDDRQVTGNSFDGEQALDLWFGPERDSEDYAVELEVTKNGN